MYIPKRYGESKAQDCPFCGKTAITKNKQGVYVCLKHKDSSLDNLRCLCGSWLELKEGKWGPYFNCPKCGNINLKKALEANPVLDSGKAATPVPSQQRQVQAKPAYKAVKETKKEITITSDELDFM